MGLIFRTPSRMEDLALFTRHVAGAMASRAPLPDILRAYVADSERSRLSRAVEAMADRVESGVELSVAMEDYPAVFPISYRRLVRLGEQGRSLGEVMGRLAESLEEGLKTYEYFRRAAIYPLLVLVLLFLDLCFIASKIGPSFMAIFTQLGAEIPFASASFLQNPRVYFLAFAFVALLGIVFMTANAAGLRFSLFEYGRWQLQMPLIGPVLRRAETARFAGHLALLLRHRLPLGEALGLVADSSENRYVRAAIQDFHERFQEGERLGEMMAAQPLFPATMAAMITSAEDQGQLAEALDGMAKYYRERTAHGLMVIREIFEPLMLLLIGLLVAFILLSIYGPLFDLPRQIR